MALTYQAITTTTVGSGGAANIELTSIPQDYTDLLILVSARTNRGDQNDNLRVQFNGNSSSYSYRLLYGTGASAGSEFGSPAYIDYAGYICGNIATGNTFGNVLLYIPNYGSSNFKSLYADGVAETNATSISMGLNAGLWSNTSAITSITITTIGTILQHSSATLYGIKNTV